MSGAEDIEALAGEYVLGTLDAAERAAVDARRLREPALDAAILAWERRLSPLALEAPAVMPSPALKQRVLESIGQEGAGNVVALMEARVRRWQGIAAAAAALAASLALFIGLRETVLAPAPETYVAVFNDADQAPAFVMSIDLSRREVTVRPVGAPRQPGKTYQLWIASDQLGPRPRSLGLLGEGAGPARVMLTTYAPDLLSRATFGVSLEPAGGSPTGQPTSPALHARLMPAAP